MSLKSELRQSAKFHHLDCDGRFCKLDDHTEMRAIKHIAELEAENAKLKGAANLVAYAVRGYNERKAMADMGALVIAANNLAALLEDNADE